jgi:hypothetical protein
MEDEMILNTFLVGMCNKLTHCIVRLRYLFHLYLITSETFFI